MNTKCQAPNMGISSGCHHHYHPCHPVTTFTTSQIEAGGGGGNKVKSTELGLSVGRHTLQPQLAASKPCVLGLVRGPC